MKTFPLFQEGIGWGVSDCLPWQHIKAFSSTALHKAAAKDWGEGTAGGGRLAGIEACVQDLIFLSREDRDLGFPFQTPPGSQASPRGEAEAPLRLGTHRERGRGGANPGGAGRGSAHGGGHTLR